MVKIAVIMTVHNRKQLTLRCLSNLFKQEQLGFSYLLDVFMTDDGSTDGTAAAVGRDFPSVHIVAGDGTLFWNRGMYASWQKAVQNGNYDYFLWLNDDTYLYENAIMRLLDVANMYTSPCIVVGSTCASTDDSNITYGGYQNGVLITDVDRIKPCDAINGNIVLISRQAFKVLGFNDPRFRHACGDTDYGLRAKSMGVTCVTGRGVFGICDLHECMTCWKDPGQPFIKRWKNFMSPLGDNPFEFFYFKRKHSGFVRASFTFVTNWIHFFFPRLWMKFKNNYDSK